MLLRDLSVREGATFASEWAVHIIENRQGFAFPSTLSNDTIREGAKYHDDALNGLPGWTLRGRGGQVQIGGIWGAEVWLLADGFVTLSKLLPMALVSRSGTRRGAPAARARRRLPPLRRAAAARR